MCIQESERDFTGRDMRVTVSVLYLHMSYTVSPGCVCTMGGLTVRCESSVSISLCVYGSLFVWYENYIVCYLREIERKQRHVSLYM